MSPIRRSLKLSALLAGLFLLISVVSAQAQTTPPQSTFFSTSAEESYSTYQLPGDGDLWPMCWADDDNLYTANGDGTAFAGGSSRFDLAVSRLTGAPPSMTGTTINTNVGTNYSGNGYNRKPTGMLCINGTLYLAFQNLNLSTFNDAPTASIAMSTNHGTSWTWDTNTPMFGAPGNANSPLAYKFTTIFFLDFGKNSANAIDGYVYAYGLDNNWRSQTAMYLARVPSNAVMTRSSWQFYSGSNANGTPMWSSDITQKTSVLTDQRLLYPTMFGTDCPANQPVVAQGGVTYDAPLHRYLFTSWSCTTHELYEAPQPWGPWSHVSSIDFGPLRLTQNRGQYGTSIPSKFISPDGKAMYLQSNVCCGGDSYTVSLRKMYLQTYAAASPTNHPDATNLALSAGTTAISKSTHFGSLCGLNCADQLNSGALNKSEDDFDEETKTIDWWGYTWPQPYNINSVVYQTGNVFPDGGWYSSNLHVQVRQNFHWIDVANATITPAYPYSNAAGAQTVYTFNLPNTYGDGVRITGTPGGSSHFTSITQLGVYYGDGNLVSDPGFELQATNTVSPPWGIEGPDPHGIDRGAGFAHTGSNNAWLRNSTDNWNSITQAISVKPNTNYTLTGWVQNNFSTTQGYFGVRASDGVTVVKETSFGPAANYTLLTVAFNSGSNSTMKIYAGFYAQNVDHFFRLDDVAVRQGQ